MIQATQRDQIRKKTTLNLPFIASALEATQGVPTSMRIRALFLVNYTLIDIIAGPSVDVEMEPRVTAAIEGSLQVDAIVLAGVICR